MKSTRNLLLSLWKRNFQETGSVREADTKARLRGKYDCVGPFWSPSSISGVNESNLMKPSMELLFHVGSSDCHVEKGQQKKLDGDRYKKSRKQDNGSTFALFFGPGHSRSEKKGVRCADCAKTMTITPSSSSVYREPKQSTASHNPWLRGKK